MESKPVKNWSLCMHGQCIDMVSDLHDMFIGDVGKYKFTYEVKRIYNMLWCLCKRMGTTMDTLILQVRG